MSTLEQRATVLEEDMREVKGILARMEPMLVRMDERLNHVATRAELADLKGEVKGEMNGLRVEVADIRADLAEKPSKTYMWGVVGVMTAAIFGAVVLGAGLT